MAGKVLEEVSEEKDLAVILDKDLKFHSNTAAVVNKVNRLLGLIQNCFTPTYPLILLPSFINQYLSMC